MPRADNKGELCCDSAAAGSPSLRSKGGGVAAFPARRGIEPCAGADPCCVLPVGSVPWPERGPPQIALTLETARDAGLLSG